MTSPAPALVTMGETLAAFSSDGLRPLRHAAHLSLGVGGAESNTAIGAARLGVKTAWIGRVGNDELGRLVTSQLAGEGVEVRASIDQNRPTALMLKSHRTSTLMNVDYYRQDSAGSRLSIEDLDPALISGASFLHISAITPGLSPGARAAVRTAISIAKETGVKVSIDLNYRAALWTPEQAGPDFRYLASQADVLFSTLSEARIAAPPARPKMRPRTSRKWVRIKSSSNKGRKAHCRSKMAISAP
nr:sugar kinase [Pseudarthrobacter psychrotolerans]